MRSLLLFACTVLATLPSLAAGSSIDFESEVTAEDLGARIAELNPPDKGLPDDLLGLNDERQALSKEMTQLRALAQDDDDLTKEMMGLDKARSSAASALSEFAKITDCGAISESQIEVLAQVMRSRNQLSSSLFFLNELSDTDNPWDSAPAFKSIDQTNARDVCTRWKAFLARSGTTDSLLAHVDLLKTKLLDRSKASSETRASAKTLMEILQK